MKVAVSSRLHKSEVDSLDDQKVNKQGLGKMINEYKILRRILESLNSVTEI